jgi:beta-1,4-mannosyl-glycoprotein beta-1,4-N-acetylglucosaminyltransferase
MSFKLGLHSRQRRPRLMLLTTLLAAAAFIYYTIPHLHSLQDGLSYSTRPLWDTSPGPKNVIAHLHAPGLPANDTAACSCHDLKSRSQPHVLWDATLLSTELDMLEIRLRELWDVVDKFVILESTHSMTGNPKVSGLVKMTSQKPEAVI